MKINGNKLKMNNNNIIFMKIFILNKLKMNKNNIILMKIFILNLLKNKKIYFKQPGNVTNALMRISRIVKHVKFVIMKKFREV